ncbi:MAG: phosphoribosylanthranilate isomerase [Gemmataceae bacterium]
MAAAVRVKICGLTSVADVVAVAAAGADALGLNFYPPSPRSISLDLAPALLHAMPPFVEPVGVFVRTTPDALLPLLDQLGTLRSLQIHGTAPVVAPAGPYRYIPAVQIRQADDVAALRAYLRQAQEADQLPAAVLVDGHAPGLVGGTGQTAPWALLEHLDLPVPLILAGGLTPDNVAEAVRRVRPWAVDVASGVESTPGRKDIDKVKRFVAAVREAADDLT